MPRFNNGNPGTVQGRGFGNAQGQGQGQGMRSGRRSISFGKGQGQGQGLGQGQAFLRDPDFFRRNCLGIAEEGVTANAPRVSRFESMIENLQRQIDELKRQFGK